MSTLAVLGNTTLTTQIANRLTRAGHTVRTHGLLGTDDSSTASTVQEAVAGAVAVLAVFDSAAAVAASMASALPAMDPGTHWLDLGPAAGEDTAIAARAERHGITRVTAPLAEFRGILVATAPAVLDHRSRLACEPILDAVADLVIISSQPELGVVGLEAQFGDLVAPTSGV
ncbi:hypothetical protein F7Q99_20305 [Streptomyces kaniharaensis]|uniref:NAD(P)-binding domain-containing protein n=1 Tax=Streptomyces kaniharaensis TaxID=212423 RepID=A0A6N7KSC7_9ACTN|nr:hypothetical protein [Streptomyces kaniharaensis]MQS14542.1 hypothetical protein [Streptomyces kaniharaensis]